MQITNGIGSILMTTNDLKRDYPVANGFTNKEILYLIKQDVENLHDRIDFLHEKINKTPSRQEIIGWFVAISSSAALLNTLM